MPFASCNGRIRCIVMEEAYNDQELDFPSVFEVIGEPAIVINGVPDVIPGGNLDVAINSELERDPCFGDWLEGRKIQKLFGDQYYSGKVEKYDGETKWYRVVYEDGDCEDLEWHELEEVLSPLDISIPPTILASHRCKLEKSVARSQIKMARGRKNDTNSIMTKEKTSELLQIRQGSEPRYGKPMEANFSERTPQGTLQLQNGFQPENKENCFQMSKHDESFFMPAGHITTSNTFNGNMSDFAPVFEVIGEPAIVINGVPEVNPGCTPAILSAMGNPEVGDGACFGEWLEGRKVKKLFGDRCYLGKVEKYDNEINCYTVLYEDGDFEDLEWHELENALVPLDISIPLTTLALHMCKSENHVLEPQIKHVEARKNHTNNLGRTMELCHVSQVGEQQDRKVGEANVKEKTHQENMQMPKGLHGENIEPRLQMCWHEEFVSNQREGTTIPKINLNGNSMGMMLNMLQVPERADINGDGLGDAHREASVQESLKRQRNLHKQSGKTARAEKQRRKENSFLQNSAYHSV